MRYLVSLGLLGTICLLLLAIYPRSSTPQAELPTSVRNPTVSSESPSSEQAGLRSTVEPIRIDSKLLDKEMYASVYLPPGYSSNLQYPVLYLFHGYGGHYGD